MSALALAVVDSRRPTTVLTYPPTPARVTPKLTDELVDLFLYELTHGPHRDRPWTKDSAAYELQCLMAKGGVSVAWEMTSSTPLGIAICEAYTSDLLPHVIKFPPSVLSLIYGQLGRDEPFLVFTCLSVRNIHEVQRAMVADKLFRQSVEQVMKDRQLSNAIVLLPVSRRDSSPERQALLQVFHGKRMLIARHPDDQRYQELWGARTQRS